MATTTTTTNKPLNPRAQDLSPKGYNRANIFSGKALDFDGVNDNVDIGSFSMSGNNATFVFNYKQDAAAISKFVFDNEGARVSIGQGDVSGSFGIYTSSIGWRYFGSFESSKWYGIAVIVEGSTAKCYANGVPFGDAVDIGETLNFANVTNATIGARYSKNASYFNGQIAGFKIFNTALTPAQVSDLYLNPEKIVPDGVASSALKLWLPMMEGAGASAYDGSGNGNDGTINGATWTAGIGAPVAQTALVSWNKGTNLVQYSESFDNAAWTKTNVTITANDEVSPDGYTNADKITDNANNNQHRVTQTISVTSGTSYTASIFVKNDDKGDFAINFTSAGFSSTKIVFNLINGTVTSGTGTIQDYGNGWYRISATEAANATGSGIVGFNLGDGGAYVGSEESVFIYGAQIEAGSYAASYIPTLATAQTSPVLLPQGLTANKDITGVNAFESARNAFALNLDGASWAEVHDNASLDVTTGLSLEGWVYVDVSKDIRGALIAKYKFSQNARAYSLELDDLTLKFILSSNGTSTTSVQGSTTISTTGWYHFVGTYDGSNVKVYLNGSEDNTAAYSGGIYAQDYPVTLGVLDTASQATSIMEDQLANPRVYNRALTAAEVLRNYNADRPKFGL